MSQSITNAERQSRRIQAVRPEVDLFALQRLNEDARGRPSSSGSADTYSSSSPQQSPIRARSASTQPTEAALGARSVPSSITLPQPLRTRIRNAPRERALSDALYERAAVGMFSGWRTGRVVMTRAHVDQLMRPSQWQSRDVLQYLQYLGNQENDIDIDHAVREYLFAQLLEHNHVPALQFMLVMTKAERVTRRAYGAAIARAARTAPVHAIASGEKRAFVPYFLALVTRDGGASGGTAPTYVYIEKAQQDDLLNLRVFVGPLQRFASWNVVQPVEVSGQEIFINTLAGQLLINRSAAPHQGVLPGRDEQARERGSLATLGHKYEAQGKLQPRLAYELNMSVVNQVNRIRFADGSVCGLVILDHQRFAYEVQEAARQIPEPAWEDQLVMEFDRML